jgi:transposase
MPKLDPATRNIAIGRLQAGESQNEVTRTLNVNQSTISKLWNRFQQTGSTNDRQQFYRIFGAIHGILIFQRRCARVAESQI